MSSDQSLRESRPRGLGLLGDAFRHATPKKMGQDRARDTGNAILAFGAMVFLLGALLPMFLVASVQVGRHYWPEPQEKYGLGLRAYETTTNTQSRLGHIAIAGPFTCGKDETCRDAKFRLTIPQDSKVTYVRMGSENVEAKKDEKDDSKRVDRYWVSVHKEAHLTRYLSFDVTCTSNERTTVWVDLKTPLGTETQELEMVCP